MTMKALSSSSLELNHPTCNIKCISKTLTNYYLLAIAVNVLGVGWDGKAGLTLTDGWLVHCYSGGKLAPSVKYTLKQGSENKL